jgi:hypothetical protein
LIYNNSELTLSDDVLAVVLEVDVQLIFQMHPKMKAFLSKQKLQGTPTISISGQIEKIAIERTYLKIIYVIFFLYK